MWDIYRIMSDCVVTILERMFERIAACVCTIESAFMICEMWPMTALQAKHRDCLWRILCMRFIGNILGNERGNGCGGCFVGKTDKWSPLFCVKSYTCIYSIYLYISYISYECVCIVRSKSAQRIFHSVRLGRVCRFLWILFSLTINTIHLVLSVCVWLGYRVCMRVCWLLVLYIICIVLNV